MSILINVGWIQKHKRSILSCFGNRKEMNNDSFQNIDKKEGIKREDYEGYTGMELMKRGKAVLTVFYTTFS